MGAADWMAFFVLGWGLPFTAYVVAQVLALYRLRGNLRWVVFVPVLPMVWVAYVTAEAWAAQSNIWPIIMIFASPVAFVYVALVALVARLKSRSSVQGQAPGAT